LTILELVTPLLNAPSLNVRDIIATEPSPIGSVANKIISAANRLLHPNLAAYNE